MTHPDPLPPRETQAHRLKVMTSTPGVRITEHSATTLVIVAEDQASLLRWVTRLGHAVTRLGYTITTATDLPRLTVLVGIAE